MSKIKESKATRPTLNNVTYENNNQPKNLTDALIMEGYTVFSGITDVEHITASFPHKDSVTNYIIFSIVRYMREHIEELSVIHSTLFILLENLKSNLLARLEGFEEDNIYSQYSLEVAIIKYIFSRIQSVLDNPSSIKEDKMVLLYMLRACIYAIRSKNNRKLGKLMAKVAKQKAQFDAKVDKQNAQSARYELVEKDIALALGTYVV